MCVVVVRNLQTVCRLPVKGLTCKLHACGEASTICCFMIIIQTGVTHFTEQHTYRYFIYYYYWLVLYSAILCSQADSLHFCPCDSEWVTVSFYSHGVLTVLFGCCMMHYEPACCSLGANSLYTIQPCTSLQCHFIQSHIDRVHVCLAVTCHLHFWQNILGFFMCYFSNTEV